MNVYFTVFIIDGHKMSQCNFPDLNGALKHIVGVISILVMQNIRRMYPPIHAHSKTSYAAQARSVTPGHPSGDPLTPSSPVRKLLCAKPQQSPRLFVKE